MTSVGYVGFGQVGRERERENTREKIFFFTCLCAFRGRRRPTLPLKMTLFWHFFLWTVHETTLVWTKHAVSFKRKWRQKSQFSNQSSICDLFNQVLNCNFHFKNHFNCILVEFKCQPWCWLPFSFWSLILDLRN